MKRSYQMPTRYCPHCFGASLWRFAIKGLPIWKCVRVGCNFFIGRVK